MNNEKRFFSGFVKAGTLLCVLDIKSFDIDNNSDTVV